MNLASSPFPVPLSPWIKIGTPDAATFSTFWRTACIAAEEPKIMWAGGSSPLLNLDRILEIAGLTIGVGSVLSEVLPS